MLLQLKDVHTMPKIFNTKRILTMVENRRIQPDMVRWIFTMGDKETANPIDGWYLKKVVLAILQFEYPVIRRLMQGEISSNRIERSIGYEMVIPSLGEFLASMNNYRDEPDALSGEILWEVNHNDIMRK